MLNERDLENPDPIRLDREIARAALAVRSHHRALRDGGSGGDPFLTTRLVTTRTAFLAVREMPDGDPLKPSLVRWVFRLAEQRINLEARMRVEHARRFALHVVNAPEHDELPLSAMLGRALSTPKRREAWLATFLDRAEPLGDETQVLWERRQEVAVRLGLAAPDSVEGVGVPVEASARAFLEHTKDAFHEVTGPSLGEIVSVALAETATEGWPRHLLPRTLSDLFRETDLFRSLDLDPGRLPAAVAPASFLRAIARVGAGFVDATAPANQPFVIAHDPYGLGRRTFGALLGMLPASEAFARRALGLTGNRLADHVRATSAALLVAARLAALRVLLRAPALEGRRAFREAYEGETHDALGVALPPYAAGALVRLHEDDAQRFAGSLLAASRTEMLRDEFDEDWYRNPRTTELLRDEVKLSPVVTTTKDALEAGVKALEAQLTRVL